MKTCPGASVLVLPCSAEMGKNLGFTRCSSSWLVLFPEYELQFFRLRIRRESCTKASASWWYITKMGDSEREGLGGAFILLILARLRESSLCCLTTRGCGFCRELRGYFPWVFFHINSYKNLQHQLLSPQIILFFFSHIIWARYFFIQHSWFLDHPCSFSMQLSFCCSSHKAAENQGNSNILSEGDEMWDRFSVFLCHCWSPIQSGTE